MADAGIRVILCGHWPGSRMNAAPCFAIYGPNQLDHPGKYVVRRFLLDRGIDPIPDYHAVAVVHSLEEARRNVPTGLVCASRSLRDNAALIECWVDPASLPPDPVTDEEMNDAEQAIVTDGAEQ